MEFYVLFEIDKVETLNSATLITETAVGVFDSLDKARDIVDIPGAWVEGFNMMHFFSESGDRDYYIDTFKLNESVYGDVQK